MQPKTADVFNRDDLQKAILIALPSNPVAMSVTAQRPPQKASLPIELLPTDLARIFTHIHPALLLSAYYVRFPALVADPTATLLNSLAPLAVIQIIYAVICLPPTGTSPRPAKKSKASGRKTNDAFSAKALVCFPPSKPTDLMLTALTQTAFFALLLSFISVPVLATIQVLFGAPVTTHIPHTLLGSAHIALLAVFPLVYAHGSNGTKWREVLSAYSPIDEVFGGAVGCLLGAWLGAVPIPLDWDREWQKWPVTIVTGAYAGYAVGKLVGGKLLKGNRIELD